ncbi:hypothetical protein JYU34_002584 [Plutella xylostella]|uniref:Uncharacterized protein n=1 Tax=Plutella xylostella TaxID=51655 RepID=A0ABQ7R2L4_PLUXY|nr:hypothetical protein JYU34_002584 [Plutella xylostella]
MMTNDARILKWCDIFEIVSTRRGLPPGQARGGGGRSGGAVEAGPRGRPQPAPATSVWIIHRQRARASTSLAVPAAAP